MISIIICSSDIIFIVNFDFWSENTNIQINYNEQTYKKFNKFNNFIYIELFVVVTVVSNISQCHIAFCVGEHRNTITCSPKVVHLISTPSL